MGSPESSAARRHLRLAEGLIGTVRVGASSSEFDLRNAFSRSYYALFHASRGYLWARGFDVDSLGKKHGRLHDEMERKLGTWFGDSIRKSYESRRKADYVPEWTQPPLYKCLEDLKVARGHCYYLLGEAREFVS